MTDAVFGITSPTDSSYIGLGAAEDGRYLRKKILPMNGSFIHPKDHQTKIFIDESVAASIKRNFENRIVGKVQVPAVNDKNEHTEDPLRNLGEVIGIDYDKDGVYATIHARKHAEDFGKTILDSSAFLHMNYINTTTGERVGPTLLHVAATNRGHVMNMGDYEEFIRGSADISDEKILFMDEAAPDEPSESTPLQDGTPTNNSNEHEEHMTTKDEALAFLKENEGVAQEFLKSEGLDVEALQAEATRAAELSTQLEAVNEELKLSGDSAIEIKDLAEAVVELSSSNKELKTTVASQQTAIDGYAKRDAEHEVDGLIREGRVLPAQREVMVKLSMTDRETFDALIPENSLVSLSESGVTVHEETTNAEKIATAVASYVDRAKNL